MKKILLTVTAFLFVTANAFAAGNVGISGAFTGLSSSGTETTKSSGETASTTRDEDVVVPSVFIEFETRAPFLIGLDIVPVSAELGSGTGDDDDAETSGANKASAELSAHATVYALLPLGSNGAYLKAGAALANVDTTETLATGTKYGNESVTGYMLGLGFQKDNSNGSFLRLEATYTDYEDLNFKGSFNGNAVGDSAVRNEIDADVDATAVRISLGKAF